jgi:hypothetical protein
MNKREELYSDVVARFQSQCEGAVETIARHGYANITRTLVEPGKLLLYISHDIVKCGHVNILKQLSLDRIDPDSRFAYIYNAITYHQDRVVKYLVELFGSKFYHYTVKDIIDVLASCGNYDLIRFFHHKSPDVNLNDALIQAIDFKSFKTVKYLLDSGANINRVDEEDRYPFEAAVESGDLRIVKYLVLRGVDLNSVDNEILHKALGPNFESMFDYLSKLGFVADTTLIDATIMTNSVESVEFLITRGLSLENYNIGGLALFLSAYASPDILKYVLSHAEYRESTLSNILEYGLTRNHLTIEKLRLLLEYDAQLPDVVNFRLHQYNLLLIDFILSIKPSLASGLSKNQHKALKQMLITI